MRKSCTSRSLAWISCAPFSSQGIVWSAYERASKRSARAPPHLDDFIRFEPGSDFALVTVLIISRTSGRWLHHHWRQPLRAPPSPLLVFLLFGMAHRIRQHGRVPSPLDGSLAEVLHLFQPGREPLGAAGSLRPSCSTPTAATSSGEERFGAEERVFRIERCTMRREQGRVVTLFADRLWRRPRLGIREQGIVRVRDGREVRIVSRLVREWGQDAEDHELDGGGGSRRRDEAGQGCEELFLGDLFCTRRSTT